MTEAWCRGCGERITAGQMLRVVPLGAKVVGLSGQRAGEWAHAACPDEHPLLDVWTETVTVVRVTGEAIRARRLALGWSLREVARRCEVSAPFLCDIEAGHRQPSDEVRRRLLAALSATAPAMTPPGPTGGPSRPRGRPRRADRDAELQATAARLLGQGTATEAEVIDALVAQFGLMPATIRRLLARGPRAGAR